MSTVGTLELASTSFKDTETIAEQLGHHLKGGEVIELVSDLGGGKTTFVRGLARGAGSRSQVASPTFTVSRLYQAPRFNLYHFDFYRLADAGSTTHELEEAVRDPSNVVVVEWASVVEHVLPNDRLTVEIKPTADNSRSLTITYPDSLQYLVENYVDSHHPH